MDVVKRHTAISDSPRSKSRLSKRHILHFDRYAGNVIDNFFNWGSGAGFTLHHHEGDYTSLPSTCFDNETVYFEDQHIHAAADQPEGGDRSKAELHFVHLDTIVKYRAVVAFRHDPGSTESPFFASIPLLIGFNQTIQMEGVSLDH